MAHVDLDAKRAARADRAGEPHSFTLAGQDYTLPATCPIEALDLLGKGEFTASLLVLFRNDTDALERFYAVEPPPDDDDLSDILSVYGKPGNSGSSRRSS